MLDERKVKLMTKKLKLKPVKRMSRVLLAKHVSADE